jgi:5,10-methylenetetrahydrofolate reductase
MHIRDVFKKHPTTFSFEFFPPKDEPSVEALYETIAEIEQLKPSFVSVTYGAGGSTRERTHDQVEEGADFIATQLFFDNRDFYDFRDRCRLAGIDVPIVAGIMPITSRGGMKRMADLAAGARYPAPLLRAINRATSPEGVRRVGIHWATEQCRDLLDHDVAGIHFYTLNKSTATREIYKTLGVQDSLGLI